MKTIVFLLMVFFSAITTQGAYFEYYDGGLTVVCEAYAQDYYYYDGPYSSGQTSQGTVWAENEAATLQASSLCRNSVICNLNDNSLYIRMFSLAVAVSLDSYGYTYGVGGISTQDNNTIGVFYEIKPDIDEELGNDVIIYWTGQVSIEPMGYAPRGDTSAFFMGPPSMNHMAITKNQLPPVTVTPNPVYEIWTMPAITLYNQSHYGFEKIRPIQAQIGDVIGIFIAVGASNVCSGYQSGTIISNLTLTFTVESPLFGDLDGDNDVDFQDFAKFANNWLMGT